MVRGALPASSHVIEPNNSPKAYTPQPPNKEKRRRNERLSAAYLDFIFILGYMILRSRPAAYDHEPLSIMGTVASCFGRLGFPESCEIAESRLLSDSEQEPTKQVHKTTCN